MKVGSSVHHNYLSSAVGTTSSSNSRSTLADVSPVPQQPSLLCQPPSHLRANLLLDQAVSVVYSHTDRNLIPGPTIEKISEVDGGYADPAAGSKTDGGVEEKQHSRSKVPPTRQRVNALTHSTTRPRRSASLSDASSVYLHLVDMNVC
jgi:hypothetical protein